MAAAVAGDGAGGAQPDDLPPPLMDEAGVIFCERQARGPAHLHFVVQFASVMAGAQGTAPASSASETRSDAEHAASRDFSLLE